VYPNNAGSVSGTYGGTLIGQVSFDAAGTATPTSSTSTTLTNNGTGLFVVGIPAAGVGSGVFAFFAQGITYTGAIIAIIDPGELKMTGILKGEAFSLETETLVVAGVPETVTFTFINGYLGASLTADIITIPPSGVNGGVSGTRLVGTAIATSADANNNIIGSSTLIVDGFLQSPSVTGTVDLSSLTNTQSTGSGGSSQ
jgi:hypothetical protein